MKKLLALTGCILSFSCFAASSDAKLALAPNCEPANINDPAHFCEQFKKAAKCYCDEVLHRPCPSDMNALYALMMAGHSNLEDACRFQYPLTHLDVNICIQHWNYQRSHCQ